MDVTVEFIENTTAKGSFIILQNISQSRDTFVAVPRSQTLIENIPASMYTVFVYDLEQDGMPNTSQAYEQTNYITMSGEGKKTYLSLYFSFLFLFPYFVAESVLQSTSEFLKYASAQYFKKSNLVKVDCCFKDGIEDASCVLVYREYGNKTLIVKEYQQNSTVFPKSITVDGTNITYTFAVFGKNGSVMDERPLIAVAGVEIPAKENASNLPVGLIAGTLILEPHGLNEEFGVLWLTSHGS